MQGLNRTSVGLKLQALMAGSGIFRCLNRTSVGLKQPQMEGYWSKTGKPQSNQRGIETGKRGCPSQPVDGASIEPAWD